VVPDSLPVPLAACLVNQRLEMQEFALLAELALERFVPLVAKTGRSLAQSKSAPARAEPRESPPLSR
jgi:hypothetical protein